ncbi:MAG: tRNA adenosine(34) deaminase TadA [Gemmatimonadetes bacterium]|nr:tRNA adenosine(34) deaminase TadA [Gemmatimonadota bacterium]
MNEGEHEEWLRLALEEARSAGAAGDVPVGAVIVHDGVVIGRGQNRVERLRDPTAHAEMLAIREASSSLGYERLAGATIYVTLEPCAMCAGAIVLARLDELVYGADDPKTGACGSLRDIVRDTRLNHQVAVTRGVLAETCSGLLKEFFRAKRGTGETGGSGSTDGPGDTAVEPRLPERCESG